MNFTFNTLDSLKQEQSSILSVFTKTQEKLSRLILKQKIYMDSLLDEQKVIEQKIGQTDQLINNTDSILNKINKLLE